MMQSEANDQQRCAVETYSEEHISKYVKLISKKSDYSEDELF